MRDGVRFLLVSFDKKLINYFDSDLSKMKLLVAALEEIESNTCIRFVHADSTTRDYIRVINDTG